MNKIHKQRFVTLALLIIGLGVASALIIYALRQNLNVFLTPSEIALTHPNKNYSLRLGGVVKANSLQREREGLGLTFTVTDFKSDIVVRYQGILPDLFREGKGVITEGRLNAEGIFIASRVLAKHDENYMPKNVYQKLRNQVKT